MHPSHPLTPQEAHLYRFLNQTVRDRIRKKQRILTQPYSLSTLNNLHNTLIQIKSPEHLYTQQAGESRRKVHNKISNNSPPRQVVTLEESIHDRAEFSRRLRLFLHRKNKSQVLQHVDREKKDQEAFRKWKEKREIQKKIDHKKNRQQQIKVLRKASAPGWLKNTKRMNTSIQKYNSIEPKKKQFTRFKSQIKTEGFWKTKASFERNQ